MIPWTEAALRQRAAEMEGDNAYWRKVDGRIADKLAEGTATNESKEAVMPATMTVEIQRTRDNQWRAEVRLLPGGELLNETQTGGPGYTEICEEVGKIVQEEIDRQLALGEFAFLDLDPES